MEVAAAAYAFAAPLVRTARGIGVLSPKGGSSPKSPPSPPSVISTPKTSFDSSPGGSNAAATVPSVLNAPEGGTRLKLRTESFRLLLQSLLVASAHVPRNPPIPATEYRLALHGEVYDITEFAARHPGGKVILEYVGRDATDVFESFHPPHVMHMLKKMRVGPVTPRADADPWEAEAELSGLTKDYRALRRALWEEGRFMPDPSFFAWQQVFVFALIAVSVLLLLVWPESVLVQVLLAPVFLGLGLKQAAFLGHDTMHNGAIAKRGMTADRTLMGELNAG